MRRCFQMFIIFVLFYNPMPLSNGNLKGHLHYQSLETQECNTKAKNLFLSEVEDLWAELLTTYLLPSKTQALMNSQSSLLTTMRSLRRAHQRRNSKAIDSSIHFRSHQLPRRLQWQISSTQLHGQQKKFKPPNHLLKRIKNVGVGQEPKGHGSNPHLTEEKRGKSAYHL